MVKNILTTDQVRDSPPYNVVLVRVYGLLARAQFTFIFWSKPSLGKIFEYKYISCGFNLT